MKINSWPLTCPVRDKTLHLLQTREVYVPSKESTLSDEESTIPNETACGGLLVCELTRMAIRPWNFNSSSHSLVKNKNACIYDGYGNVCILGWNE